MTNYRRLFHPGATYFFTVNCASRTSCSVLTDNIDNLRNSFRKVMNRHPFALDAIVVLPDHLHCIWTLPDADANFSLRWSLIKANFSRTLPKREHTCSSRQRKGERGIWQRRFWEHLIRNEDDLRRHLDYIHWNPVKHGWATSVADWQYSSFQKYVALGIYPLDWGGDSAMAEINE